MGNKLVASLRSVHHHVAKRPHAYLTKRSKAYAKWHTLRYHRQVHFGVVMLTVLLTVAIVNHSIAGVFASGSWTQSDWSGGTGSSTTNQYSAASNATTSTSGHVTLSQSQSLANTGFESDTSNWSTSNNQVTPAEVQSASNRDAASTSHTLSFGTTPVQGDTLFALISIASGTSMTTPTGWTLDAQVVNASGVPTDVFRKVAGASESTAVVTTTTSSVVTQMDLYEFSGVATSNPLDQQVSGTSSSAVGSYSPGTTPTTTSGSELVIAAAGYNNTVSSPRWDNSYTAGATSASFLGKSGYKFISGTQTVTGTATLGSGTQITRAIILTYKAADALTATRNTVNVHSGSGSAQLVASSATAGTFLQSVNVGNTNNYTLQAYVYTNGSAVTSSNAQLDYNNAPITTTYSSAGGGWYLLSANVVGINAATNYGLQIPAGQTVYADDMALNHYATTGSLTSAIFDTGIVSNFGILSYAATTPTGTTATVLVRSGNQANLSDASAFTSCSAVASGSDMTSSCAPDATRYVQYQVQFTSDGTVTPNLTSVTIPYTASDVTPPPTNASNLALFRSHGGASIASDGWTNGNPYFTWTAGADNVGGTGLAGYCLYLGQDPTGNPVTTKGDLGASPVNTGGACPFAVSGTNLDTSLSGYLATALTSSNTPYYLNIKAIDNVGNIYNGSSAQFEFMYDNVAPTNPAFISAPSEFVSNKQVDLTWSTTGSDAPNDDSSGVAGLQYRIGSSGTWYGVNHNGNQDASDLLPNNGSYTTVNSPDFGNLMQGNNIIYFRTWDNAGNISSAYVTTVVKINSIAPSSPQNLVATPSTNTANSFGFSWLAPATFTGSASNLTYCYTINTLPTSSNCNFTSAGQTSLDAGAYATEPGDNTLYLVAKDEAGNINYATAESVTFTANTAAPGVPLDIDIADISVKAANNWKLALSWEQPTDTGAGVSTYKVYRSTDGNNFTNVASTAGTSYVDTGLNQQTYYYKVKACDSANNCGALTNAVSFLPTGKFTTPANLDSGPSVIPTTRSATINWTTDRASDSNVEYGLSPGSYFTTEAANNNQVSSHTISLNSLSAGTTYYYRAQWIDGDGNEGTSSEGSFTTLPAPTVSNVVTGNINLNSATIQFTSNHATAVQLQYGGGVLSNAQTLNTSTSTSTYSIPLTNLNPGTTYTFKLNPYDTDGNIYQSPESHSFTTPPEPVVTNVLFSPITGALTGTEQITWDTNVPATSQISYGLVGGARSNQLDTTMTTSHSMTVSDLTYNTSYSITATSVDALGNVAHSDLQVFKSGIDTKPPTISSLSIQPSIVGTGAGSKGQLIVSWKTDKAGTSQVAYGEGTSGDYSTKTSENTALVNNHVVVVSGLNTSQVYHIQVISNDSEGINGVSPDQTTIVGQASDSALSIVFNALQSIFGL